MTCIRSRHGTAVPMRAADAEVIWSARNAVLLRADDSATDASLEQPADHLAAERGRWQQF